MITELDQSIALFITIDQKYFNTIGPTRKKIYFVLRYMI